MANPSRWLRTQVELLSKIKGVIQLGIGSQSGSKKEISLWSDLGINQIYCEPVKEYCDELLNQMSADPQNAEVRVFNLAISDFCGKSQMSILHTIWKNKKGNRKITPRPDSSTLLTLSSDSSKYIGGMAVKEKVNVKVSTIDELVKSESIDLSKYNMLWMDIEGSEYKALMGGLDTVKHMDIIYAEIGLVPYFSDSVLYDNFVAKMNEMGYGVFHRQPVGDKYAKICHDVIFVRKKMITRIECKTMVLDDYTERVNVDMRNTESIGVLCRGKSLDSLGTISKNFEKLYIVGQFTKALPLLSKHLQGKQIIQMINKVATQTNQEVCKKFNIKDIQCNFDGWTHRPPSVGRQDLFRRIEKSNRWATVHLLPPGIREARSEGFRWHTCGILGVDLAAFWKPKHIWIAGLDFYFSPYFIREKKKGRCDPKRRSVIIKMLKLLVRRDPEIAFHLITYCDKIKSFDNLHVTYLGGK